VIRLGSIGRAHRGGIPLDAFLEAEGEVADKQGLGEGAGVGKASAGVGGLLVFAGLDPLGAVADRAGQGGRRGRELLAASFRVEFQSSSGGTGGVSVGRSRSWVHYLPGRSDQQWIARTLPTAPAWIRSRVRRRPSPA
jgi:hypothetical protein